MTKLKGEMDSNTLIVEDFNVALSIMDKTSRQKINKGRVVLNNTIDEVYLIYIEHHTQWQQIILSFLSV